MLPVRHVAIMFFAFFVIFVVVLMPPATLLALSGLDGKISYSNASGSISRMEFSDFSIAGRYVGDVSFTPEIVPLLAGDFGGTLIFSGAGRQGQLIFEFDGARQQVTVQNLVVTTPVTIQTVFGPLSGLAQIRTDESEISLVNGCQSGTFALSSTLFDNIFERAGLRAPPLKGQAVCQANGMLRIDMETSTDDIIIFVKAVANSVQDWSVPQVNMVAEIKPDIGKHLPNRLTLMLDAAGLPQEDGTYRLLLPLGPNKG